MKALEIQSLEFGYKQGSLILDIPEFSVNRGETIFLYGKSGSGKSTLLGLLAGVLSPQKGEVKLFGKPFSKETSKKRDAIRGSKIGYIFQSFNLIPYLSVEENILLPIHACKDRGSPQEAKAECLRLAQSLGIEKHLHKKATELSIGQQQRVAAARALIGTPELLIADEPTSSLDADHRQGFIELLFRECKQKNITVIFVSHDRSLEKLFSRSIAINEMNRCIS